MAISTCCGSALAVVMRPAARVHISFSYRNVNPSEFMAGLLLCPAGI